jgi:EmrB/QacA subfamily drug resistance transporter
MALWRKRNPPGRPEEPLPWLALLGIGLGVFMATVDFSIVNISLPTLMREMDVSLAAIEWVALSYALVVTSLMLGVARLGDMLGKRRVYLRGLVVFTLGSLLCGAAQGAYWLIACRALQAVGAVMMQALGIAIVTEAAPASRRGSALGIMGGVVSLGLAAGPPLGGLLIGLVGWRAVFLVNVPVGLLALWVVSRHVPAGEPAPGRQRFDALGAGVLFLALIGYALGMTMGQHGGFGQPQVTGFFVLAAACLALFLRVEAKAAQPMLNLAMFRRGEFSLGLLLSWICFMVMGGMFLLPFFMQMAQGYPPERIGLLMMVVPVCMGLVAPWAGALSDRYGSSLITLLGLGLQAVGCLTVSTLTPETAPLGYVLRVAPLGLGLGLFHSPNNSAIMGAAPRESLGVAGGMVALARTLGNASGLPLMGAFFSARVEAAAGLPAHADLALAPAAALAAGVRGTYRLAMAGLVLAAGLAAWKWARGRQRGRAGAQPE